MSIVSMPFPEPVSDYQRGQADAREAAVKALASWLDQDVMGVLTESLFYAVASQAVSPSDAAEASRDPVALARLILSSPEPFRDPADVDSAD